MALSQVLTGKDDDAQSSIYRIRGWSHPINGKVERLIERVAISPRL